MQGPIRDLGAQDVASYWSNNCDRPSEGKSKETDGDAKCEFRYQPDGWKKPYRFVALRYEKSPEEMDAKESEQYLGHGNTASTPIESSSPT